MAEAAGDGGQAARRVWWLSLGQLVSWGTLFYGFGLLLAPVEQALGLGRAQSSLGFSLALAVEGLCAFPVGRWIDRGFERRVMTGGSVLAGLALLAHSQVQSIWGFYAVWMVLGMAMAGTLYTPVFAVLIRRDPQHHRRAIITTTFLGGLASTVFIPLISWWIESWGWRAALWPMAALHLLVCVPLHGHWLRGAAPAPARQIDAQGRAWRDFLHNRRFWLVGLGVVNMMAVTAALPPHMVSLLREAGLPLAWAIAIPASIGVIQVLGRVLLMAFERHLDVHAANRWIPTLIPLGLVLLLGALLVLSHPGAARRPLATALALGFVLAWGLGNGMMTIVKATAIAQYVSATHAASLNGVLGLPLAAARAAAPLAIGLLWSGEQGYWWGVWLLLGISSLSVLAMVAVQRLRSPFP